MGSKLKNGGLTFAPRSRNRYWCKQTQRMVTKSQIPSHIVDYLAQGNRTTVRISAAPQSPNKPKAKSSHPSKYRSKHR